MNCFPDRRHSQRGKNLDFNAITVAGSPLRRRSAQRLGVVKEIDEI